MTGSKQARGRALQAAKPFASISSTTSSGTSVPSSSSSPYRQPESVAVIGGGIAGLTCAKFLAANNRFVPTVFDTGRLRPGGRCSSRWPTDKPADDDSRSYKYLKSSIFDHAAQILVAPRQFPEFQRQVEEWETEGIISKYPEGTVCNIADKNYQRGKQQQQNDKKSGGFAVRPINTSKKNVMYYGTEGMGSIPLAIQKDSRASLEQDVWVSPSNGVRYQNSNNKWKLQANGQTLGIFDRIVIAHNGKCADRIMSKTPAKKIHNLLRVNFAPRVPPQGGKRMTLNSIYSLTFALPKNNMLDQVLPNNKFYCGFVQNEPTLRFLSCQTRKYQQDKPDEEVQVWTVLSSAPFAKKHKAPQEFLPNDVVENVTQLLLQGVEKSLYVETNTIIDSVLESRLQLWGAAVPVNVWEQQGNADNSKCSTGFLHDGDHNVGVCGDWLLEASIGGAWESGRRLAEYMVSAIEEDQQPTTTAAVVGVKGAFRMSQQAMKAGIGSLT
ncbi:Inherit from COG: fad dependent oxidoreductase [Seminavis robusta]|uniref:Inherit from COG: fad dependent oxidoreductase n=1 Tax=Seminavis robusta TaxID=568900 RepID=A0A9N8DS32_9STRA|nr:Inherit from COG: fad dependent oxidoreductase [Seminavis robusta]|eukprot:Sro312_g114630.1 Inherit from COG: fad dependent oxidoreductase (496) ;mRNA; r:44133-45620